MLRLAILKSDGRNRFLPVIKSLLSTDYRGI